MKFVERLSDWVETIELRAAQVLVSALIAIVFGQVITRYILSVEMLWSQEASLFCFVWSSFLGAAIAVRRKSHFVFDLLPEDRPVVKGVSCAGILAMALLLSIEGSLNAAAEWNRFSEPSGYRFTWFVLSIPVMGASMLLFIMEAILREQRRKTR